MSTNKFYYEVTKDEWITTKKGDIGYYYRNSPCACYDWRSLLRKESSRCIYHSRLKGTKEKINKTIQNDNTKELKRKGEICWSQQGYINKDGTGYCSND